MHGLVVLDEQDSGDPARHLVERRPHGRTGGLPERDRWARRPWLRLTANIAFAGFTAPKLLWMRENEPENFSRIKKIMLPKDYINYILTGRALLSTTPMPPACCCWMWNTSAGARRCWPSAASRWKQMPRLYESYQVVGTVKPEVAAGAGHPVRHEGGGRRGRQCRGGGGHRRCGGGRLQHLPGHLRDRVHLLQEIRHGPQQRPSCLCPCRRRLAPDGVHALGGLLQQMAVRRYPQNHGLRGRTGGISRRKSWGGTMCISCPTSWGSAALSTIPMPGGRSSA